ncbi:MAG: InlB B-repeat-containing protein [Treponema sp.]|nr:InlB B-repeat-containing protein [Treponema sp.]
MKNIFKKINILLLAFITFISFSCKQNITDFENNDKAYLKIQISGNQRTVFPEIDYKELTDFKLTDSGNKLLGSWKNLEELEGASVSLPATNLEETFILTAQNKGIKFYGSSSAVLKPGKINLSFFLVIEGLGTGKGNVEITLKIPSTEKIVSSQCILVNHLLDGEYYSGTASDPEKSGSETKIIFTAKDIPASTYDAYVQAELEDGTFASYNDLIYVSGNKTSKAEHICKELTVEEFPKIYSITYKDGENVLETKQYLMKKGLSVSLGIYYVKIEGCGYIECNAPKKDGYIFEGWYADKECTENSLIVTGDFTVYAKWVPTCKVLYDTNGGSNVSSETVGEGSEIYFRYNSSSFYLYVNGSSDNLRNPEKDGYIFAGWYADKECTGSRIDSSNRITVTEDITVYAKWVSEYKVSFDTNGGSSVSSVTFVEGSEIYFRYDSSHSQFILNGYLSIDFPKKDGYVFAGWYADKECTGSLIDYDNRITVTKDVTVYAKWVTSCKVSFDTNGGSSVSSETVLGEIYFRYDSSSFYLEEYGSSGIFIENPEKAGYKFAGWYADKECTGSRIDYYNRITVTEDVTVYAKWIPVCKVIYDTNDGSSVSSDTVEEGSEIYFRYNPSYFYLEENRSSVNYIGNPEKAGYRFAGWYADKECTGSRIDSSNSLTVTEDITVYAKWIPACKVIYDTNDGSSVSSETVEEGSEIYFWYDSRHFSFYKNGGSGNFIRNSEYPEKEGYKFAGWYTDKECTGSRIDSSNSLTVTEDVTVYAKWIPACKVIYDTNDGSSLSSETVEEGSEIYFNYFPGGFELRGNESYKIIWNPEKARYKFAGWYADKECTGSLIDSITVTEDITVYAKWVPECKVIYDTNGGSRVSSETVGEGSKIYFYYKSDGFYLSENGSSVNFIGNPEKDGYKFAGWYADKECTGSRIDSSNSLTVTGDVTVYAKWIEE